MKKILIVVLFGYLLPGVLYAQGIVPCGPGSVPYKASCELSDLALLINKIIDFLAKITIPFATVAFAVGGVYMILGAANPSNITRGTDIMKTTVYGIFTVFLAWIIVKAVLVALGFNIGISWVDLS